MSWVSVIPGWAKIAVGAVTLIGVLVAGSRVVVTYDDLPDRVETLEEGFVVQQQEMKQIHEGVDDVKCFLLKEARGEEPEECLLED